MKFYFFLIFFFCLQFSSVQSSFASFHQSENVIISSNTEKHVVTKFKANIHVLRTNNTTIKPGYEPMFHVSSIRQVVKILNINEKSNARKNSINDSDNILRNGDSAIVEFMFKYKPQYIKVGTRFILCEGKCKLVGEITDIN